MEITSNNNNNNNNNNLTHIACFVEDIQHLEGCVYILQYISHVTICCLSETCMESLVTSGEQFYYSDCSSVKLLMTRHSIISMCYIVHYGCEIYGEEMGTGSHFGT